MSRLDDLFGKKRDVVPVLDLSKQIVTSRDDFKRLLEKVPDYKMRPIKVRSDEIKIKDKDWSFKMPRKELAVLLRSGGVRDVPHQYLDPIPAEMRGVTIAELCPVSIDWKMLTTFRPRTKVEEDFFSRLVELGKLQLRTEGRDKRDNVLAASQRRTKNRNGVVETRIFSCADCLEEFCNGRGCADFNYDFYTRTPASALPRPVEPPKKSGNADRIFASLTTPKAKRKATAKRKKGSRKRSPSKNKEQKGKK
ncbi:uncharacterized protein LOC132263973 [Phlebotomus argentipes]|uniref:uncharacterized protein LOC132263973 n=1 Tax=Phlebotomus argentipes TaxID=94469 RepID=UPI002892B9E3|nr:uncharacterized protein LOC132263973 [Phlebotomus argentipes]